MGQSEKGRLWRMLQDAGYRTDKPYRNHTLEEMRAQLVHLGVSIPAPEPTTVPEEGVFRYSEDETPIRVEPDGTIIYREEVPKPAVAAPRKRRVLTRMEPGVRTEQLVNGEYLETFEVQGDQKRQGEVRITMPTYQVGIKKDPRYPWRIHSYGNREGFNFEDVVKYYGGTEMLVPDTIKRIYVGNDLCFDPVSVINAVKAEYREQQLMKG